MVVSLKELGAKTNCLAVNRSRKATLTLILTQALRSVNHVGVYSTADVSELHAASIFRVKI
jgi:hypothetical protein